MPLDNYGFSPRFGWLADRFGVSCSSICQRISDRYWSEASVAGIAANQEADINYATSEKHLQCNADGAAHLIEVAIYWEAEA